MTKGEKILALLRHFAAPLGAGLKDLLLAWKYPMLVAWGAVAVLLQVLARLPFAKYQMIPHYLDFHPGVVVVPLAGAFLGPAGAWASLFASLLGDKLVGQWNSLVPFRAAGFFFFALATQKLWDVCFRRDADPALLVPSWTGTLRFVFVAWSGSLVAAAWPALGFETQRLYPFAYVASLAALNNLIFCTLLGIPLYRLLAGVWVHRFGAWRDLMRLEAPPGTRIRSMAMMIAGSVGACAAGMWVSANTYNMGILQPVMLGTSTGRLVPLVVIPLLLLHAWGSLRRQ